MPGPEFTQLVGGGDGAPISTNASGTIETDNYTEGAGFDFDGSLYPYTINPVGQTIQVLHFTDVGAIDMEVTTISGTVFSYPLGGGVGVIDWWEIDSVTFTDPDATGAALGGAWGGE